MTIEQLKAEAKSSRCGERLARCAEIYRQDIFTTLAQERLLRKYHDIEKIYTTTARSKWNEVFYMMLMRTLSDEKNRDTFMELAQMVTLSIIQRESAHPRRVEALLLAASGFLECYPNSEYTEGLRSDAIYMLKKYALKPMSVLNWNLAHVQAVSHPVVKFSQITELLCGRELIFNDVLQCRTLDDINEIFAVKTTQYFIDVHPYLVREGRDEIYVAPAKRVLIGINLIVPILYAYGYYLSDENICIQAQELNESLPAEMNRYIKHWRSQGVYAASAHETQALIQLSTVYCRAKRCEDCIVARRTLDGTLK